MDRKLKIKAWVAANIMLLASAPAMAAGLGKLTVTSGLGQPFLAEIALLAVDKKDLGSIRASFASFEAFKEANIERSPALSTMRFSVEQKKNGDSYLKITSSKAIEEPFLDMLIELDWPSGRLVREYTVLLDPPSYGAPQLTIAPVTPPVTQPVPAAKAEQPPAVPAGAMQTRTGVPRDSGAAKAVAGKPAPESYGPVKKGETLSGIATSLKFEGLSLDQMLVALFQSNKQAFGGNNMNRLKAGQILRVPVASQVAELEKGEVARQVKAHAADWHAYRQKLAASVAEAKPAADEAAKQAASGKITTAVEDRAAPAKESAKDVLKLSKSEVPGAGKPAAAGAGAGGKEMQGMKEQIHAMQEEATAKEKAIKEANQRITELEKNIKDMQQLLELKNQNLADLQKQAVTAKTAPPPARPEEKPGAPVAEQKAAPAAKPKKPKPVLAEQKKPELSLLDELMDNPLYLGGGAAILLLALLGLGARTVAARRNRTVASFEDSIMTSGDLKGNTVLGSVGGGKIDTNDTSFLTDFSQAGMGSIDTNEVDPIAEAEVYMAYGRDAQAEEILREALAKDPGRHEIRLKLLEIYAGRKNLNAFEAVAGEMYAAIGGQASPIWDKAAELGRTLDPQNPLYSEKQKAAKSDQLDKTMLAAGAAELGAMAEQDVMLDLGGQEMAENAPSGLDFNLDLAAPAEEVMPDIPLDVAPVQPVEESEPEEEAVTDLGFDFDLGALAGAEAQPEQPAAEETVEAAAEPAADMGLDFNLDMGDSAVSEPAEEAVESLESAMEFDLGMEFPSAPEAAVAEEESKAETHPDAALISAESWQDEVMSLVDDAGTSAAESEMPSGDEAAEAGGTEEITMPDLPGLSEGEGSEGEEAGSVGVEEAIELAAPPADESLLDFDFNLDQEEAAAPHEAKGMAASGLDFSGISLEMDEPVAAAAAPAALTDLPDDFGSQEVSTKLDLARAYVDMGDKEGAREILQEVLKEGATEQQEEARKLLAELD